MAMGGSQQQSRSYHAHLKVERENDVTTVTIDRPERKNACTGDMWVAIGAAFRDISYSGARVVVLTGAGGDFCAGADLGGGGDGAGRTGGNHLDAMRVLGDVVLAVHDCPVPVVAKVDGVCVGAGLGLALAADMTWCSDRARFSAIFAKRGLSLDFGTSWLLRQRIGAHVAKQLAFTAEMVSGPRALELGFVNAVIQASELD
jgi:enoyl-CoA hydratase/carnithine racemase